MNYPLLSEYIEAIKSAEDNFDELNNLRAVLDENGEPVMSSGNFAVVFKMKDEQTGKLHAVKCFLKEQEGRAEAYRMIAEELEYVNSTFLTPIKYLDKELFVDTNASDETEFPVLLMDWVEGQTLDKNIREHIYDQYELSMLAYQFSRLAMWLMPQPFAHGDLKPDNILVKDDGTLVLVDYDGMYVPAMKGQKARELGSPDFRHPSRTEEVFDEHIDDFSLASILLSLKAIALQPELLEEYGASDRLLFSEKDYCNLSESKAMDALRPFMQDSELASLYSLFILALSQNNLSQVSFRLFYLNRPDKTQYEEENLSTEVTKEDLENAWTDEYGVKYSADRKRLLKAPEELEYYTIREGTKVICTRSFIRCKELSAIYFPSSVTKIGRLAFFGCKLKSIKIPNGLREIGPWSFSHWKELAFIEFPESLMTIGQSAFYGCISLKSVLIPLKVEKIERTVFGHCSSLEKIMVDKRNKYYDSRNDCNAIIKTNTNTLIIGCSSTIIPDSVTTIGEDAFSDCDSLQSIDIPNSVSTIGECAFQGFDSLQSIDIPNSVTTIGDHAFCQCGAIRSITVSQDNKHYSSEAGILYDKQKCTLIKYPEGKQETEFNIPNSVTSIGKCAFRNCKTLLSIVIPNSVTTIGDGAFFCCKLLRSIDIPDSVKTIGSSAFHDCVALRSIKIPDSVTTIEEAAFDYCVALQSMDIPGSVTSIGNFAFRNCTSLTSVTIPNSVTSIGIYAFSDCKALQSIDISDSVTSIGKVVFHNCKNLKQIIIPVNSRKRFEELLPEYKDILVEKEI